jgi:seryl-tRNA synthetase
MQTSALTNKASGSYIRFHERIFHPHRNHHHDRERRVDGRLRASNLLIAATISPQAPPETDGAFFYQLCLPGLFYRRKENTMDDFDHRQLGNQLDLFHQQEEGSGMIFWHPRGTTLYRAVEDYMRERMRQARFMEVRTPQLLTMRCGSVAAIGKNSARTCSGLATLITRPR